MTKRVLVGGLLLAACGGSVGSGGAPPPSAGAVHGSIVDGNGAPAARLPILVAGVSVTTDENGGFAVADAPAAYDVAFVVPGLGAAKLAIAYEGLTSRTPKIQGEWALPANTATIHVTPPSKDASVSVLVRLSQGSLRTTGAASDGWSCRWDGASAAPATIWAIATTTSADGAATIVATAKEDATLASGSTLEWSPTWQTVDQATLPKLAVKAQVPADANALAFLSARTSPDAPEVMIGRPAPLQQGAASLPLPPIDGAIWDVGVGAQMASGSTQVTVRGVGAEKPVEVSLMPDLDATSPADGATDVAPATAFTVARTAEGAPYMVQLWSTMNGAPQLTIYAASEAHVPDLSPLGVSLSGQSLMWQAATSSALVNLDDYAAKGGRAIVSDQSVIRSSGTSPRHVTLR